MSAAADTDDLSRCARCTTPFAPRSEQQRWCSGRCREQDRHAARYRVPAYIERRREDFHRWRLARDPEAGSSPWLRGGPPYGTHLPGGACTLSLSPAPRWPIALRNLRALHGVLTHLRGKPHCNRPDWSILPWSNGWAVYLAADEDARALAGRAHAVDVFNGGRTLTCGPLVRMRAPTPGRRGHQRVRLDTITPVAIRSTHEGGRTWRTAPTADNVINALVDVAARVDVTVPREWLRVELVERATQPAVVDMGGKYVEHARGFEGHLILECNAPARWLLECAARGPGLGGRVAFGFGRVRVEILP